MTYRIVDGLRERMCARCEQWKPHNRSYFYLCKGKPFGLQTTCSPCLLEQSKLHHRIKEARYRSERQFARESMAGST